MNDVEKVMGFAEFMYSGQGYVDVPLCEKATRVPAVWIRNILVNHQFKESKIKDQYIK